MTRPAGLRAHYGHVEVYDGRAAQFDTTAGRWYAVCEKHGFMLNSKTLADAKEWAKSPTEWCWECYQEQEATEKS